MKMNKSAALKISMVILDVDGVMTDGRIGYGGNKLKSGVDSRIKFFNSKDDHMIRMAIRAGLQVAIISGRADEANVIHADELGISIRYFGEKIKLNAFENLLKEHQLSAEQCLYVGDDVMDIPLLKRCAIGVAVSDATDEAKAVADLITTQPGGQGAVREVLVQLMKLQGHWDKAMARYQV